MERIDGITLNKASDKCIITFSNSGHSEVSSGGTLDSGFMTKSC